MARCENHQSSTRYFSTLVLFRVPSCNKTVLLKLAIASLQNERWI